LEKVETSSFLMGKLCDLTKTQELIPSERSVWQWSRRRGVYAESCYRYVCYWYRQCRGAPATDPAVRGVK